LTGKEKIRGVKSMKRAETNYIFLAWIGKALD